MHFLKLAFLSIIFLFLVITGISLFIPSHVRISRATNIPAGADSVMDQISNFQKWRNWYPSPAMEDPDNFHIVDNKALVVDGTTITLEKTGKEEVAVNLHTINNKNILSGWNLISKGNADSATLQWYMDFHLRWYPWEKFSSIVYDKVYGMQMEKGLTNLKKLVTNNYR